MYVNRLLLQLAILVASHLQLHRVLSIPSRLLDNHWYNIVPEMSKIQLRGIHIDQIYFAKDYGWYSLYSQGRNVPDNRKYFLPWEVKFLQMTSGKATFSVTGLVDKPNLFITCQFKYADEFQDFHREIYLDRLAAYTSNVGVASGRFATWQAAIPGLTASKLKLPDSLKLLYELVGLTKIKKHDWKSDGDEFRRPEILARSKDNVQIYIEDHKGPLNGKPTETYTVFTVPWVQAEKRYVPKVQIIFGTGYFKIVDYFSFMKIIIMIESDYYVLSFPESADITHVLKHFKEIAQSTIYPTPPEVEFYLHGLE